MSAASIAIGVVACFSKLTPVSDTIETVFFGLAAFLTSIVMHEYAHVAVLKRYAVPANILQIGVRLGIIHKKPARRVEVLSSLAGPVAGLVVCGLMTRLLAILPGKPLFVIIGCTVGLFHAASLLPFYGDGASLFSALRERKRIS